VPSFPAELFFTVNRLERRRRLLTDYIDDLRTVFADARRRQPFTIDAILVLPDHLHAVWTLPAGDGDFFTRARHHGTVLGTDSERRAAFKASRTERGTGDLATAFPGVQDSRSERFMGSVLILLLPSRTLLHLDFLFRNLL